MCTPQSTTGRIRLNVGGQVLETTADILTGAGEGTMLGAMLEPCWNAGAAGGVPEHFIDRDPVCFASLLDMLRTGELHAPAGVPDRVLFREASYYGLLDRVRAARIGEFDLDRARLVTSVPPGRAPMARPAVRASPDGGCCVTHGPVVRVYNWMLEEPLPICLTPTEPQTKVFASCNSRDSGYYGIGVWDCITGEHTDSFLNQNLDCALGTASKLQWLSSTNALMVIKACSPEDSWSSSSITLVYFRDMSVVWSWCSGTQNKDHRRVADAVVMEDERSVCLISQNHDLGFLDIRCESSGLQPWPWTPQSKVTAPTCYPKLAVHSGLLLASKDDTISVYGGPNHDHLRLALRGSQGGGAIADFSVGGDRLFAVHHEDNVLDVWATLPRPPPIA
ncbi:BTB/POZ domain-containing protein At2g24240-like [Triticum dicoccoides]|uniref:BTB/POZ domain-containing protein At2g24240-like n=1 Tax=Triticum dicoccoides TaxID=85692 RepID=UPI00189030EC|nr:BTB/POZ domain-containing protein At2g24240-like [Triticum dicoccoides]